MLRTNFGITRLVVALLVLLIIVGGVAGYFVYSQFLVSKAPAELVPVDWQTAWTLGPQDVWLFKAVDAGWFKEVGIDLRITPGSEAVGSASLLATGQLDFLHMASSELIAAVVQGLPIVAIMAKEQVNAVVFYSLPESNITKPEDWVGKTVALEVGGEDSFIFEAICKKVLTPEQRATITVAPVSMPDPTILVEKKVDVCAAWRSDVLGYVQRFGINFTMIKAENYGVVAYGDVLATNKDLMDRHPEIVREALRASAKGIAYSMDPNNYEEMVNITTTWSKGVVPRNESLANFQAYHEIRRSNDTDAYGYGWIRSGPLALMQDLLYEAKQIDHEVSPEEFYTQKFLTDIYTPDGKLIWPSPSPLVILVPSPLMMVVPVVGNDDKS